MATRGVFRYSSGPVDVDTEAFARKNFPDIDLATCSREERSAMVIKALEYTAEEKEFSVSSLREHPLSIRRGGAQLCFAPSLVDLQSSDFRTPLDLGTEYRTESQWAYYKEMENVARKILGPQVVHAWCFSHILRRSDGQTVQPPIAKVHNDFTEEYGESFRRVYTDPALRGVTLEFGKVDVIRSMLKQLKGLEFTAEEMAKYRVVMLNAWRPISKDALRRDSLAVCDNRSIRRADLRKAQVDTPGTSTYKDYGLTFNFYESQCNSEHKWYYVPEFTSQELLVFPTYDSDKGWVPTLHSSFELPNQEGAPPRESCEVRVLCLLREDAAPASRL